MPEAFTRCSHFEPNPRRRHFEPQQRRRSPHRWATMVAGPEGPPTPPPELYSVWNSRAELVSIRQKLQNQLFEEARQKGVYLMSFFLGGMRQKWEDYFYQQKEDFFDSESRRLLLVREDLALQKKMCQIAASHLGSTWVCHNCLNLDSLSFANGVEMGELVRAKDEIAAARTRVLNIRRHHNADRAVRLKEAEREYRESQLAVLNRVAKDGRTTPRNSDSLLLHSDDHCLNGSEDDDESTLVVGTPVVPLTGSADDDESTLVVETPDVPPENQSLL